jgi:hypothetical protein
MKDVQDMKRNMFFTPSTNRLATFAVSGVLLGSVLLPAAASAQTVAPTASTTKAKQCATGEWSKTTQGRPTMLQQGSAQGAYLWHDRDGWHLRVTHPGTARVDFAGTIQSSRRIAGVARSVESKDQVNVVKSEDRIDFAFTNYGRMDGIDFRVGCSNRFVLNFSINGVPFDTSQLFIGSGAVRPSSTPFVVERT